MTIAAILARKGSEIVSLPTGSRVRDAVAVLALNRIGAIPILDAAGQVAGILSERDIVYCLETKGAETLDSPVDTAMTAPAITIGADVPVISALSQMSAKRIRHLPVVEGGKLVGFVSIGDLVAHRIRHIEQEADAMRAYIQGS